MGLYDVTTGESPVSNFHAGTYPIAKVMGEIADGEEIRKHAIIAKTTEGIAEVTEDTVTQVVGIAAEESTEAGVAYYATGEFQTDGVLFDESIDLDELKEALEKINIYLK